jgi:type II secretory pathway pseudopilin PulG
MDTSMTPRITPKDFFLYLGTLITLYFSVGSLINLSFTVINRYLPDALEYYTQGIYSSDIRISLAILIIIFPTYLILSWIISRDTEAHPEKKLIGFRRWLTYVHLFITGVMILGTLVTVVNYFLGGEITIRFLLKVLAMLIITGGVFGYYVTELRSDTGYFARYKLFAILSGIIVLIVIVSGFFVIGLPQNQRNISLDEQRVYNLQNIQGQITEYFRQKQTVPATLTLLNDPLQNYTLPTDPETNAQYSYTKISSTEFTLCADFKTNTLSVNQTVPVKPAYGTENWLHAAEKTCFTRTIDPELYPSIKK